jgi:hypothetical protein
VGTEVQTEQPWRCGQARTGRGSGNFGGTMVRACVVQAIKSKKGRGARVELPTQPSRAPLKHPSHCHCGPHSPRTATLQHTRTHTHAPESASSGQG